MSVFIVVFIVAYLGGPALETFMKAAPTWLLNGLSVAGAVLPAVGLGLILMYLGLDKYKWLFIIAFILVAFVSFSYMFAFVLIVGFIVLYR